MLLLKRKLRQAIMIGKNVRVSIERIDGDTVTLGFFAPREIGIYRRELLDDQGNPLPHYKQFRTKVTGAPDGHSTEHETTRVSSVEDAK